MMDSSTTKAIPAFRQNTSRTVAILAGLLAFSISWFFPHAGLAQCPVTAPTSTPTASSNCLTPNGFITFSGPNTTTHVFSIDGGTTFGILGQTTFTNLAPGVYQTVAKNAAQGCVSVPVSKTITASSAPAAPTSGVTPTNCNAPTGVITFTAPALATHVFSVDGGATFGIVGQTVFTGLAAGNYNTVAKLVSTGCVSTVAVKTIVTATAPTAAISAVGNSTNCLSPNGTITFSAPIPTASYQFSIDGGTTYGTAGQLAFTGLAPGNYQTRARLVSTGCQSVVTTKTITSTGLPAAPTSGVTPTNCNAPTGVITFTAPAPATHIFSIDGGVTFGVVGQTAFTGLAAGNYSTVAKLVSTGCVSTTAIKTITVVAPPVAPTSTTVGSSNCLTPNGSITFTGPVPLANYQFSIDGGATFGATGQTAFPGLAPGTYVTVAKLVSTGCVSLTTAAATKTIAVTGAPVAPTSVVTPTNCTAATGTITFSAPAPATHVFSIDGGATFGAVGQTVFTGLDADNYQTVAQNVATGCLSPIATKSIVTVALPAAPTSTVTNATNCNSPNGAITFSAPSTASHLFSIDGGQTYGILGQTVFTGLAPGTYETMAINVTSGCESLVADKTVAPATAVAAPTSTFANVSSCLPNNGSITFNTPTPVANYQFSIDGGVTFGTAGQTAFTGLAAGGYTTMAKLVSTGCVSTTTAASVKVLINTVTVPAPSFVAANGQNNCATLGSIVFSAPSPVTHVFSIDGGLTFGTPGQVLFTGLTAGTYSLVAKLVSTGCQSPTAINTTVQIACNNVEICGNGIDDDADGFIDQYDTDCPCTVDGFVNVCQPNCEYQPTAKPFTIKKAFSTPSTGNNRVAVYQTPAVGDVDGDGVVELVGIGVRDFDIPNANGSGSRSVKDILIFNGKTGALERTISTGNLYINWGGHSQLALGNTDKSDAQAEIYTITITNITLPYWANNPTAALTCYKADGTLLWRNTTALVSAGLGPYASGGAIGLADFNGDGIAEVYVYNKIYNAVTGALLVDGAQFGTAAGIGQTFWSPRSVAADLTAHPGLELAAGKSIYEITITNPNGTVGNTIVEKRMPTTYPDGNTAIADMDLDGQMDVIVRYNNVLYVYDPRTMGLIARATVTSSPGGSNNIFIGDVDNDGRPDIGLTAPNYIGMYTYNGTPTLVLKWSKTTTDGSGTTGITMFDFNQDGNIELLYRDETNMRIMNGTTGNNIVTFPSASGTGWEGPVVADVNSDGQANIIVTSGVNGGVLGVIDIFSTASFPWAPSREVWNQVGYNVTNINDDLTIPTNPQDNSAIFSNGKRILNNFMQQSTLYDENGDPVFPAVDVKITFVPNAIDPATGYSKASTNYFSGVCENSLPVSASLTIPLVNNGNIPTPANMPVSIYLGDPFNSATAVLVQTIIVSNPIAANGGTFTTGVTVNTTGFTVPFKLYAIPGDPGATTGFPLTFTTYFQDLGFCASQSNNAVYGDFNCDPPCNLTITASATPTTACVGQTVNLNVTIGGNQGVVTYAWTGPNSFTSNIDSPVLAAATASMAGTYTVVVSDPTTSTSCSQTALVELTIGSLVVSASSSSATLCAGEPLSLSASVGPPGNYTYSWTGPDGFASNLANPIVSASAQLSQAGSYSLTVTDAGTCSGTATVSVTVGDCCDLVVNATPVSATSCSSPNTGALVIGYTGSGSYQYSLNGGANQPLGTSPFSVNGLAPGSYTVIVSAVGSPSCFSTTVVAILAPQIAVTASSNSPICVGSPLNLFATSNSATATYSWTGPNNFNSAQQNPTIPTTTTAASGVYTVQLTDGGGCTASVSTTVTIATVPSLTITAGPSLTVCSGQSTTLAVAGSNGAPVTWTNNLGQSGAGAPINFAGIRNISGVPQTITYTISANLGPCSDQKTVSITINPEPVLQVVPQQAVICAVEQTNLVATTTPNTATITWSRVPQTPAPFTGTGTGSVTVNELLPAGNYTYTFTATGGGCTSSPVTVPLTVNN